MGKSDEYHTGLRQLFVVGTEGGKDMEHNEKKYDVCKAWADWRLEGVEEGKIEGKIEERQMMILEQLEDYGEVSEEIRNKVVQERRLKIKIFNREICVCALLATNSFMRKKQRRNGVKHRRIEKME